MGCTGTLMDGWMIDEDWMHWLYHSQEARLSAVQWLGIDAVNISALFPCRADRARID